MFVKICGITTAAAVEAAVAAGADALGFVFADSVRQITPERAVELTADLSLNTARVAVMLHPSPAYWNLVRDVFKPDWLQTDVKDFSLLDVPDHIGHLPVYRDTMDIDPEITDWPEHLLFEGKRSGQGALADWDRAAVIARRSWVHPWGVDVSSGVESEPGVKDVNKIAAFIDAARKVENHAGQ
jgi:phosphoribosylanthranilate isomerase